MPQQKASAGGNPHSPPLNFLSPAADRQKLSAFSSQPPTWLPEPWRVAKLFVLTLWSWHLWGPWYLDDRVYWSGRQYSNIGLKWEISYLNWLTSHYLIHLFKSSLKYALKIKRFSLGSSPVVLWFHNILVHTFRQVNKWF